MSTKGFLILAQNSEGIDYIRQAYALALSIKLTQPTHNSVSLLTNDIVPEKYKEVFDNIIPIPWKDHAENSEWKVENRWKFIHVSPYDETIVLDSDMLFLDDMTSKWEILNNHDVFFSSYVKDFRGNIISVDLNNRKVFEANALPNVYFAFHYFKKTPTAFEFYKALELVVNNWESFYSKITPNAKQKWLSMDVSASVALKILGLNDHAINSSAGITFTHMKPNIQRWPIVPSKWTNAVDFYINQDLELFVSHYKQHGLFHYVENEFLNDQILKTLEDRYEQ
jgi:hypothetical protein